MSERPIDINRAASLEALQIYEGNRKAHLSVQRIGDKETIAVATNLRTRIAHAWNALLHPPTCDLEEMKLIVLAEEFKESLHLSGDDMRKEVGKVAKLVRAGVLPFGPLQPDPERIALSSKNVAATMEWVRQGAMDLSEEAIGTMEGELNANVKTKNEIEVRERIGKKEAEIQELMARYNAAKQELQEIKNKGPDYSSSKGTLLSQRIEELALSPRIKKNRSTESEYLEAKSELLLLCAEIVQDHPPEKTAELKEKIIKAVLVMQGEGFFRASVDEINVAYLRAKNEAEKSEMQRLQELMKDLNIAEKFHAAKKEIRPLERQLNDLPSIINKRELAGAFLFLKIQEKKGENEEREEGLVIVKPKGELDLLQGLCDEYCTARNVREQNILRDQIASLAGSDITEIFTTIDPIVRVKPAATLDELSEAEKPEAMLFTKIQEKMQDKVVQDRMSGGMLAREQVLQGLCTSYVEAPTTKERDEIREDIMMIGGGRLSERLAKQFNELDQQYPAVKGERQKDPMLEELSQIRRANAGMMLFEQIQDDLREKEISREKELANLCKDYFTFYKSSEAQEEYKNKISKLAGVGDLQPVFDEVKALLEDQQQQQMIEEL